MPSISTNAVLAAVGIALVVGAYFYGYVSGGNAARVKQLEEIVEAERERQDIDNRFQNLDDYSLCLRLVRVPDKCEQLRGVEGTPSN